MANPILDLLLKAQPTEEEEFRMVPPAVVARNADTVARGEVPEGVDMDALLASVMAPDTTAAINTAMQDQIIQAGLTRTVETQSAMDAAYQAVVGANTATLDTFRTKTAAETDVATREARQVIAAGEKLNTLIDEQLASNAELNATLRAESAALNENFARADAARQLNVIDLIKDPINFLKTKIDGSTAQKELEMNIAQIDAIDRTHAAQAAIFTNSVGALQTQAQIKLAVNESAYLTSITAGALYNEAVKAGEFNATQFEGLQNIMQLDNTAMSNAIASLNADIQKGQLTRQGLQDKISALQATSSYLNVKRLSDEAAKSTEITAVLDKRVKEYETATGVDLGGSLGAYMTLRDAGAVTQDVQITFGQYISTGNLGAATLVNSSAPFTTAQAMINSGQGSLLSPDMINIVAKVDSWRGVGASALNATPGFSEASDEDKATLRNQRFTDIMRSTQTDANGLFSNGIAILHAPKSLDFMDGSMPNFPAAAVEEMKTWNPDTTTLDGFIRESLALAGKSKVSVSDLANGMAQIMELHLNGIVKNTGLPLSALNSPLLGDRVMPVKDATNPGVWAQKIQIARTQNITSQGSYLAP